MSVTLPHKTETNKKKGLDILIAASEAAPLAKAGGLGDVAGSLPLALRDLGCRVTVMLPAYREAISRLDSARVTARDLPVRLGKTSLNADMLVGKMATGVQACLVRQDALFDRDGIYGETGEDYPDNAVRFIFFSKSIPVFCRATGFHPDVILANDWHTGLVMALLAEGVLPRTAGIFAIHNMGYLGLVPYEERDKIGLPESYYGIEGLEFHGRLSMLKAGIVYARAITTVSPTYAREIQTPEAGAGLDGLMRSVRPRLHGILNGVDYGVWDPATDRHLAENYTSRDLSGKRACKKDLLRSAGLPEGLIDRPLIGMVTRLVDQKGCGLVAEAAEKIFSMDTGLVLLGKGDRSFHDLFSELRARNPDRLSLNLGFDPVLAHKIIAGCDIFLVPSLYEPCGLTQLYSLKYGTIPVVRATGGLRDSVLDPEEGPGPGNGFKFEAFQAAEMLGALSRALRTFRDEETWHSMMKGAMSKDFSWRHSAAEYLSVFDKVLESRRGGKA